MGRPQQIFIEKIGVRIEKMGYSPLSGRIFGALLLANPPHLTFDELCSLLSASKSSISNNLKILMRPDTGVVEYFTLPGERKRYFRINTQNWIEQINSIPQEFKISYQLLEEIMAYRKTNNLNTHFTNELEKIHSFYKFMVQKLPLLFEEWEKQNLL